MIETLVYALFLIMIMGGFAIWNLYRMVDKLENRIDDLEFRE